MVTDLVLNRLELPLNIKVVILSLATIRGIIFTFKFLCRVFIL